MASHEHRLATDTPNRATARRAVEDRDAAVVRFAGDASDGIQLMGTQFAATSASCGNVVWTLPDPPAEIRSLSGSLPGVTAFQVHFGSCVIQTPGDRLNALVAMNPAAIRAHIVDLEPNGILIVNSDGCLPEEWEKAGFTSNPLTDPSMQAYRLAPVPMNQLNREAVARVNLSPREAERCKSFFVLGIAFWLYDRPLEPSLRWIRETYAKNPAMIESATRTMKAGYQYGESCERTLPRSRVGKADLGAGRYRLINGTDALALGILTTAKKTNLPIVFAGFPQPAASGLLHRLCDWKHAGVKIVQAEDDAAAINLALGASFGGALGITATTGPGLALQSETLGLAVMSELPCVVIDFQRAGPSAGMPTKTEQSDLRLAMYGRNGDAPLIVLAPQSPSDCFNIVQEAARLAIRYMSPVIVLADAYLAECAETWRVPEVEALPGIDVVHALPGKKGAAFQPYSRNDQLARPWATPGTPGMEHRISGLEKEPDTGNVSFDGANHSNGLWTREKKIENARGGIGPLQIHGPTEGELLVVGWGSSWGAIQEAAERCRRKGLRVASAHLRHLHPMPKTTGELLRGDHLRRFYHVAVVEQNLGQLSGLLRAAFPEYRIDPTTFALPDGAPISVAKLEKFLEELAQPDPTSDWQCPEPISS